MEIGKTDRKRLSEEIGLLPLATVSCCSECALKIGLVYASRIGGTWQPQPCPYCANERHLGEYFQNRDEALGDRAKGQANASH